jgi:hypothetical protein
MNLARMTQSLSRPSKRTMRWHRWSDGQEVLLFVYAKESSVKHPKASEQSGFYASFIDLHLQDSYPHYAR